MSKNKITISIVQMYDLLDHERKMLSYNTVEKKKVETAIKNNLLNCLEIRREILRLDRLEMEAKDE